ncbi:MAG TPA: bifunctional UDP-N-acetylglucosamine diphosphorylase/glucosamine-1-phosphate N-acetyltransferase GlmU [Stellaceae bacterium]|jgi:bifunctional UDP-N-acetylglucosamine pyrophosphorylase/glucosamine-1-phosphate N-acetyltransferase|nr:bifunctional UDP-N-acetylglucosamine diphosphorylase/glucosamine-1-phosphate N-acetyltransferase GlmU [Stellaceae bacterium]
MSRSGFAAIILAAGEGTRLKSARPKVLHEIAGQAMVRHVIDALAPLEPAATVVVLGHDMAAVAKAVAPAATVTQIPRRGTGDAVRTAAPALADVLAAEDIADVIVLFGDAPLLRTETIAALLAARHAAPEVAVAVSGMRPADPAAYGRLIIDRDGTLVRIVEATDANDDERAIGLCNGGIMAIDARHAFALVDRIGNDNAKREFYLTDIVAIAREHGLASRVADLPAEDLLGVNTRAELATAEAVLQGRLRQRAMENGATLIAPETVFFCADTRLGRDVVIEPNVVFGPGVTLADNVRIRSFSHIEGAVIASGAIVGPFARLRPGAVLETDVHVGNFVEVKASRLGAGVKASHLTYLGDSEIGAGTNIGAGTITCNYDGYNKHRTVIGERVFIGSDTALVAPVAVGDGAIVAAGSVVTHDVPADALTIARGQQVDKPGRAAELRARLQQKKR